MALAMTSTKFWVKNDTKYTWTLLENKKGRNISHLYLWVQCKLDTKPYGDIKRKENYKCKNAKQNISKSNLRICKTGNIS